MKKIINIQNKMIRNQIDIINAQNSTLSSYIEETQDRIAGYGYYSFLTIVGVVGFGAIILLSMNNILLEQQ